MPPKGYVQCFCHDCSGRWQPRSTRNGHHRNARCDSSSKHSKTKHGPSARSKARKKARDPRPQEHEQDPLTTRDMVMEEDVRMDDAESIETHTDAAGRSQDANKDASWAASILSAICSPQWAFITSSLPPPSSSPSSNVLPTHNILVNSLSGPASTQATDRLGDPDDMEGPSLAFHVDQESEPVVDDPYSDGDGDGGVAPELPLPPVVLSEQSQGVQEAERVPDALRSSPVHSGAADVGSGPCRPPSIPLNKEALARMDDPDPFYGGPHTPRKTAETSTFSLAPPAVVLAMLLVAWLHLTAHLPFRFCDVILTVIGYILAETGQNSLVPHLRGTLAGSLSLLRLEPSIKMYPTCPDCLEVYPESVKADMDARRNAIQVRST